MLHVKAFLAGLSVNESIGVYRTHRQAKTDVFDCIQRFHNPGKRKIINRQACHV